MPEYSQEYIDDLAHRLTRSGEELRAYDDFRDTAGMAALTGHAFAVSDMIRDLDQALASGAPLPTRWGKNR